jgi:hypothetical protein
LGISSANNNNLGYDSAKKKNANIFKRVRLCYNHRLDIRGWPRDPFFETLVLRTARPKEVFLHGPQSQRRAY